jgi:tetratricopeptide (TPR) repeat protein
VSALQIASELAFQLDDWQKAEDCLTRAIQITVANVPTDPSDNILCGLQMRKARLMSVLGRPEEALVLWKAALGHVREDPAGSAAILIQIARTHLAAGRPGEYANLMRQVFSELPRNPNNELVHQLAFVFADAGSDELNDGRFESAIGMWQTCIDYLRVLPNDNRESIEAALINSADCLSKLGRLDSANQKRQEALAVAAARLGEDHGRVMNIRDALAFGLLESEIYSFEKAESLLDQNLAFAKRHGQADGIAEAVLSLAKAHRQRGKYDEAVEGVREILRVYDGEVGPRMRVKMLREMSSILSECGLPDAAAKKLNDALKEAKQLPGPSGLVAQIGLLAGIANLLAEKDPEDARRALTECYDLLVELPAGVEPVSMKELQLLSLILNGEDGSAKEGESITSKRLEELEREAGHSGVMHRVHLLREKAQYQKQAGDTNGAIELLLKSKSLLEQRFRHQTTLYGAVVSELADLLPPGNANADEYREKAEQIFQRAQAAVRYLQDDEGEGEDY